MPVLLAVLAWSHAGRVFLELGSHGEGCTDPGVFALPCFANETETTAEPGALWLYVLVLVVITSGAVINLFHDGLNLLLFLRVWYPSQDIGQSFLGYFPELICAAEKKDVTHTCGSKPQKRRGRIYSQRFFFFGGSNHAAVMTGLLVILLASPAGRQISPHAR